MLPQKYLSKQLIINLHLSEYHMTEGGEVESFSWFSGVYIAANEHWFSGSSDMSQSLFSSPFRFLALVVLI